MKKETILFIVFFVLVTGFSYFNEDVKGYSNEEETLFRVSVSGEVKDPQVLDFNNPTTVIETINLAGGLTDDADVVGIEMDEVINSNKILVVNKIEEKELITVTISGNVKYPGIYDIEDGSRNLDLINVAGGLLDNSDTEKLNYTMLLKDGSLLYIKKVEIEEDIIEKEESEEICVYISGEVLYPGVYQMESDDILNNLIEKAVLTRRSDISNLNLAKLLENNESIYVDKIIVADDSLGLININTASFDSLKELPGIGDTYANKIIAYRKDRYFSNYDEVRELLGDYVYQKIKTTITF